MVSGNDNTSYTAEWECSPVKRDAIGPEQDRRPTLGSRRTSDGDVTGEKSIVVTRPVVGEPGDCVQFSLLTASPGFDPTELRSATGTAGLGGLELGR